MVFVNDLELPLLSSDDHHHLARVLRVPDGAEITVSDGAGRWRSVLFRADSAEGVPETVGEIMLEAAPPWELTVAFAPVKGDRPEWVVQKLTELGIDRIIPITSQRSVVRWDAKRWAKQELKWQRIGREASMQSRRVRLPTIESLVSLDVLLSNAALSNAALSNAAPVDAVASSETTAVFADPDGAELSRHDRLVVIGPEGGWALDELVGRSTRSLPGGVLRAETAAVTVAVIMALHRDAAPATP